MRRITLPRNGKVTTQLGFGCAYLQPETAFLLDVAYSAGIRHFDVARAYGRGQTESLVGRFLKNKADVTVCSKYGIKPPISHPLMGTVRSLLRPLVRKLRRSPALNQTITGTIGAMYAKEDFTGAGAKASLEYSLRQLGRDHLDIFLMHEADAGELGDPTLLEVLSDCRTKGLIGDFGVGGDADRLGGLVTHRPGFCDVLQYNWTINDPAPAGGGFHVVYRTFSGSVAAARQALRSDAVMSEAWSRAVDYDLARPGAFERLILKATLDARPDALVLFSSTRAENIADNVAAASDDTLAGPAARLATMVRSHAIEAAQASTAVERIS